MSKRTWKEYWGFFPSFYMSSIYEFKKGGKSGELYRRKKGVSKKEQSTFMRNMMRNL